MSWNEIELKLFFAINHLELPDFMDQFLISLTQASTMWWFFWILVPACLIFLVVRYRLKGVGVLLFALAAAGLTDMVSYRFIKQVTFRLRPQRAMEDVILRVAHSPESSSFPSNHAATTMAAALVLSYFFPKAAPVFILISFLTGFSRLYAGVHYPTDVLGGWVLGTLVAGALLLIFRYGRRVWSKGGL